MTLPDWEFNLLEELIQSRGEDVILETGMACTCRREDSIASMTTKEDQPSTLRELNCTTCQGDGFVYRGARRVHGLVTSIQAGPNRKLLEGGYAVAGDSVFSPSLHVGILSDFDKITFLYPSPISDGQVIMRGAATMAENADRRIGVSQDEDRLWYQAAAAIWCEDANNVVYSSGTDFVLQDKVIRWVGNRPNKGTFYTLKYTAYLEWIIYNTPMTRIDNDRTLAQRVLIRKKHVAFSTGSFADTALKRKEEEEQLTTRVTI